MKFTPVLTILILLLPFISLNVHAEGNCPSGYYPIGGGPVAGCAPIPGDGGASESPQWQSFSAPAPVWQDYWGALAGDEKKGVLGAVTNSRSESAAQQAAMADCAAKGGIQCKIENTYRNGCMAMVVGDRVNSIATKATLNQAIASGMQECQKGDKSCTTVYSACSLPVRIQ